MEWYLELLLQLYRSARELSIAEFPEFAFYLLKSALRFDSARYTSLQISDAGSVVHTAHVHNDSHDTVFDWEQINRHDTVVPTVTATPGRVFAFHARTLFAAPEKRLMRDYTQKSHHENMLVCAQLDAIDRLWHSLSLYRASPDDHYAERDRGLLQLVMPHLLEAISINEALGSGCARDPGERASLAIAGGDGVIHYAGPGFVELLHIEWPGSCATRLPHAVQLWTQRTGSTQFRGRSISISREAAGDLLFLRARALTPCTRLSVREQRVAALYGAGHSHKEIARKLGISPVTARNHLQRIYAKLGISDKAQLAVLMARENLL
jgi:DNA-binding CsgD family transcriptional regulator